MKIATLFLISISLLMGCATTYQSKAYSGGYSETRLGENIFKINFSGNAYTGSETATDYCLLRAAEVTLEHGYRYFIIVDSEKHIQTDSYTTPSTTFYSGGSFGTATTYGGQTYNMSKPSANNTILCFKDKPENNVIAYDANFVSKSIRQKHEIGVE